MKLLLKQLSCIIESKTINENGEKLEEMKSGFHREIDIKILTTKTNGIEKGERKISRINSCIFSEPQFPNSEKYQQGNNINFSVSISV